MKSQKILFLQLPSPPQMNVWRDWAGGMGTAQFSFRSTYGHDEHPLPYMSLLYCLALMKEKGFPVSFLDAQAENYDGKKLIDQILKINPSIIIVVLNLPSIYGDLDLLKKIKQTLPTVKIIAIGTVCKVLPHLILESDSIDYLVHSDPEVVIPNLIQSFQSKENIQKIKGIVFKQNGKLIFTQEAERLKDLNLVPSIPYELLPIDKYWYPSFGKNIKYMPIASSRGCPFDCSYYCPYPLGFGKKVSFRDPLTIVDEIELLSKVHGVEGIVFRDQNFTINKDHTIQICNELIKRKINVKWVCETRFNLIDEKILQTMKKAGCKQINFGLETADPSLLMTAKPGVKEIDKIIEIIYMLNRIGIKVELHLMIGLPQESWETIKNTVIFLKKIRKAISYVGVAVATPYPGTQFFQEVKKNGLLLTEDWSKFTGFQPVMYTKYMTPKDLKKAQSLIYDTFHFPTKTSKIFHLFKKIYTSAIDSTLTLRFYKKISYWWHYFKDEYYV